LSLVDGDGELQQAPVFRDDPHGIARVVDAARDPDEVDERQSAAHRLAQRPVVGMVGVGAAVLVADVAVGAEVVFVGRELAGPRVSRPDRQRRVETGRLPDAGLHDQLGRAIVEDECVDVGRAQTVVGARVAKIVEMDERGRSDSLFDAPGRHRLVVSPLTDCCGS
jgi:hypothetical protein